MRRIAAVVITGMVVAVMTIWGLSPARGIIINGASARMTGGGWVAIGDVENAPAPDARRAHIAVGLPCPGAEVGFNPQPDPPGHLNVKWGGNSFRLTQIDTSRCSLGGPDTFEGSGVGDCNGQRAAVAFTLTDGGGRAGIGNPDTHPDSVRLDVRGATTACTLTVAGPLGGGNLHMVGDPADG